MSIPGADSPNAGSDSLKAGAASGVDVDSGDDKKLLGIMNEFAESMSEEGPKGRTMDATDTADIGMTDVTASTVQTPLDLSPSTLLSSLPQRTGNGQDLSFSHADPFGNSITVSARRLENGNFEGAVDVEIKHANGATASRSSARTLETPDGQSTSEYVTEMFDPKGQLTYQLRRTEVLGEGTHVFEKVLNEDGTYSETSKFVPMDSA